MGIIRLNRGGEGGMLPSQVESWYRSITREGGTNWSPLADVYETRGGITIVLEIADTPANTIDTTVKGGTLWVSGTRVLPEWGDDARVYNLERAYGFFSRGFELPSSWGDCSVETSFRNGVMFIHVAKRVLGEGKT